MAAELRIPLYLWGRDQTDRHWGIADHRRAHGIWTSVAAAGDVEDSHVHVAVIVGGIDEDLKETHKSHIVSHAGHQIIRSDVIVDGQRDNRGAGSYGRSGGQRGRSTGDERVAASGQNLERIGAGISERIAVRIEVVLSSGRGYVSLISLVN